MPTGGDDGGGVRAPATIDDIPSPTSDTAEQRRAERRRKKKHKKDKDKDKDKDRERRRRRHRRVDDDPLPSARTASDPPSERDPPAPAPAQPSSSEAPAQPSTSTASAGAPPPPPPGKDPSQPPSGPSSSRRVTLQVLPPARRKKKKKGKFKKEAFAGSRPLPKWSTDEVRMWLRRKNHEDSVEQLFERLEVNGAVLQRLTFELLLAPPFALAVPDAAALAEDIEDLVQRHREWEQLDEYRAQFLAEDTDKFSADDDDDDDDDDDMANESTGSMQGDTDGESVSKLGDSMDSKKLFQETNEPPMLKKKPLKRVYAPSVKDVELRREFRLDVDHALYLLEMEKRTLFYSQLAFHLAFTVILIGVMLNVTVPRLFDSTNTLVELLAREEFLDPAEQTIKHFGDLAQPEEFVAWMQGPLYNAFASTYPALVLSQATLVGALRLRQVRVRGEACSRDFAEEEFGFDLCYPPFYDGSEDKTAFGPNDTIAWTGDHQILYGSSSISYDWLGTENRYGRGGFIFEFDDLSPAGFNASIEFLEDNAWIDVGTRAVSCEFTLYNAAMDLFGVAQLLFEFPAGGGMVTSHRIRSLSLWLPLRESSPITPFALWVTMVVMFLSRLSGEVRQIWSVGLRYFSDFWKLLEIAFAVLISMQIAWSVEYSELSASILDKIREDRIDFDDFDQARILFLSLSNTSGFTVFLSLAIIFHYLKLNTQAYILFQSLEDAGSEIAAFVFISVTILISFSFLGHMLFGNLFVGFHTLGNSFSSCFRMLTGDFDYVALEESAPVLGPLFFGIYIILVFLIAVNVFIAIIEGSYDRVKTLREEKRKSKTAVRQVEYDLWKRAVSAGRRIFAARGHVRAPPAFLKQDDSVAIVMDRTLADLGNKSVRNVRGVRVSCAPQSEHERRLILLAGQKNKRIVLQSEPDRTNSESQIRPRREVHLQVKEVVMDDTNTEVRFIDCKVESSANLLGHMEVKVSLGLRLQYLGVTIVSFLKAIVGLGKRKEERRRSILSDVHRHELLHRMRDFERYHRPKLRYDQLRLQMRMYLFRLALTDSDMEAQRETDILMRSFPDALEWVGSDLTLKLGRQYQPKTVDIDGVDLPHELQEVVDRIVRNNHELWAQERFLEGKTVQDNQNLVKWEDLDADVQESNRETIEVTIKTILQVGYRVSIKGPKIKLEKKSHPDLEARYARQEILFVPEVIDTSSIEMPEQLQELMELLAENIHEQWSRNKMNKGFEFAEKTDQPNFKHASLMPYEYLSDGEKEYDRIMASDTIKLLLACGTEIKRSGRSKVQRFFGLA